MSRFRSVGLTLCALAVSAAACTSGASPSATVARTTVDVTLQDFALTTTSAVLAGEVTFHITNVGSPLSTVEPDHTHQFVVLKTDLAGDSLPTAPDGSVDEEDELVDVIAKVDAVRVGERKDLTVSLDAGAYVLVCNLVEDGLIHYSEEKGIPFQVIRD
jgi:hypothetical protein